MIIQKKCQKIILSAIMCYSINTYAANENCMQSLDNFKCLEFIKNYDGDTATFNVPNIHPLFGQKLNISLAKVKSPSIYSRNKCEKKLAKEIKIKVRKILKDAKSIEVKNIARDKKFAIKGELFINGKSLSKRLLKEQMAVPIKDYKNTDWCKIG